MKNFLRILYLACLAILIAALMMLFMLKIYRLVCSQMQTSNEQHINRHLPMESALPDSE
ncbi:MAG: hypothetical protein LBI89_02950 [Prevotellaceae bacterium]|nr:hypothetical protein [Prevotellaceae bacterium]